MRERQPRGEAPADGGPTRDEGDDGGGPSNRRRAAVWTLLSSALLFVTWLSVARARAGLHHLPGATEPKSTSMAAPRAANATPSSPITQPRAGIGPRDDPPRRGQAVVCADVAACASAIETLLPPDVPAGNRSWAFLGDSTMRKTFASVRTEHDVERRWPGDVATSERCTHHAFLGADRVADGAWSPPAPGREGPCDYGLSHPGCSDCSSCACWRSGDAAPSVEYLPVEFARDVELQTPTTNTTQETVAGYLAPRPRDVCVASGGVHDLIVEDVTADVFLENVAFYLDQLRRGCARVVWVTMSRVAEGPTKYPQTNEVIREWNAALILRNFPKIDVVVDAYELSGGFKHDDRIHMSKKYYNELARAFPM